MGKLLQLKMDTVIQMQGASLSNAPKINVAFIMYQLQQFTLITVGNKNCVFIYCFKIVPLVNKKRVVQIKVS